jgi:hypothetical protein
MLHPARLGASLFLAGVLAACSSDRSAHTTSRAEAQDPASTITVTAHDYSFQAPKEIPAGATEFQLVNKGQELHQAQLIKLEEGKTLEDLAKAMKPHGPPPPWVKFMGGPNGVAHGQEANATAVLSPGQYAYLCLIPSPDGVLHLNKGMAFPFTVTEPRRDASKDLPPPDVTIKLNDYDFETSRPLTPGKHTILVENAGPQTHELVLLRMAPGKKAEDFATWAMGGMKGPPPAEALGGVVFLDKGGRGTFEVELTPGEYGLICFVPDAKDGKPHLAHGMAKTIKVS